MEHSPIDIQYHLATMSDLSTVISMLQSAAHELKSKKVDQWAYWLDPPQSKLDWLADGVRREEYHLGYVAGQLATLYRLSDTDRVYWGPQSDKAYYVHSLVVLPSFAGQNLGKLMLQHVESLARRADMHYLRLDCHGGNEKLCQYYESYGFVKVGEKLMPHSLNNLYQKELE